MLAAPAGADVRFTVPSRGPGPAAYDKVTVTRIGASKADTVLVLVPGFQGGAGDFTLIGHDIVDRVGNLQVWAVDRRSQALEDTSRFTGALAGKVSVQSAFNYYLGWLADPTITPHYQPLDGSKLAFAKDWGLKTALDDVRSVVLRAHRAGKRVILGGHSLGASMAVAYASWDFDGRPGYRDISGLLLIDGGLLGSFSTPTLAQTQARIAELRKPATSPFVDLLGVGLPWAAGVFAETGALAALKAPTAPSVLQAFPLLPDAFKPPVAATNRGAFGFAFDNDTAPPGFELIELRMGRLGPTGDWQDGEVTPVARAARLFAQEPANATEWYFPTRLTLDVDAANALSRNSQTNLLGLRTWRRSRIDVPLYAFQTSLTGGRVLRGARALLDSTKIRRSVLVDASSTQSDLDPLAADPKRNRFLQTVTRFLKAVRRP